jgi:hypothetical protein
MSAHDAWRMMNFDETISFLKQHAGKTVEVAVGMRVAGRAEPAHLVGFWGQLDRLGQSGPASGPEAWYVWMREAHEDSPCMDEFRLERELFESAEVHANVAEGPDERSESAATWTLTINQRGFVTTVEFYV